MKRSELISIRDTIQSIWVAIVLAFVLRAFVLEAFVIPTGSMAPRLMGRHLLVDCPDCRYRFPRGYRNVLRWNQAVCPNCRTRITVRTTKADTVKGGDRVLVLKFPRQVRPLRRWDVVVFKDPQNNIQNYIKRLIGLPGEGLRIIHGDVFTRPIVDRNDDRTLDEHDLQIPLADVAGWVVARKPHASQEAMWQLLFDNDYQPADKPGRRTPWKPLWESVDADADAWALDRQHGRVFEYNGSNPQSLRFARGRRELFRATNAYNSSAEGVGDNEVCSDLKLETTVLGGGDSGAVRLTLSSFDQEFAGEIHLDGTVRLLRRALKPNGEPVITWEQADTWGSTSVEAFTPDRARTIALTHADWRVTVLVDGEPVLVSSDQLYQPDLAMLIEASGPGYVPTPRVGISGVSGRFQLWHTRVMRDVFYTEARLRPELEVTPELDYANAEFSDPDAGPVAGAGQPGWGARANPIVLRKFDDRPDYDEFYMLGDNSPSSKDSRRWLKASPTLRLYDESGAPQYRIGTVPRYNLIGKAFFVYWPAGSALPVFKRLPLIPNVGKMRRIE